MLSWMTPSRRTGIRSDLMPDQEQAPEGAMQADDDGVLEGPSPAFRLRSLPRTLLQSTPQQAPARPRVSSTESAAEHLMERRKANDGQFYVFSEFVAWYGDKALASWMKADAAEDIAADGAGKHDVRAGVPAPSTAPAPTSPLPRPSTASGATADAAKHPATYRAEQCDAEPEVATAHSCIMQIAGLRDAAEHALKKEWFASALKELSSIGLQTSTTCLLKATEEQLKRVHLARNDSAIEQTLLSKRSFSSLLHRTLRTYQSLLNESRCAPEDLDNHAKRINDDLRRSFHSMRRKLSSELEEVQADIMQKTKVMLEHKWHEFCWPSMASDALMLFDFAEKQQQRSANEVVTLREDMLRCYANRTHRVPDQRSTPY